MEPIVVERTTVDRLEVARRLDDGRLDLERVDRLIDLASTVSGGDIDDDAGDNAGDNG